MGWENKQMGVFGVMEDKEIKCCPNPDCMADEYHNDLIGTLSAPLEILFFRKCLMCGMQGPTSITKDGAREAWNNLPRCEASEVVDGDMETGTTADWASNEPLTLDELSKFAEEINDRKVFNVSETWPRKCERTVAVEETPSVAMHQYWPYCECDDDCDKGCSDCSGVDREKFPLDCICGGYCYISPMPGFSECTKCDDPKEKAK